MYRSQDLLRNIMESNIKIAEVVVKSSLSANEKREKLNDLSETMETCCVIDNNIKKYELCENELARRRTPADFESNKDFKEYLHDLCKDQEDAKAHEMYRKLEEKINMEAIVDEEDLEIEDTAPNLICPISKCTMKSPMTNKLCGHVYDKSSVLELLKQNHKKGIRCPVAGCVKALKFTFSNLEPNEALKKNISQRRH